MVCIAMGPLSVHTYLLWLRSRLSSVGRLIDWLSIFAASACSSLNERSR